MDDLSGSPIELVVFCVALIAVIFVVAGVVYLCTRRVRP